ncbi:MAG: phosphoribosylformylglycinamidine synthase subunit PurQ, partial [Ilumatobacteraceae bacterium]
MSRPTALVVAGPGTNRDGDALLALDLAGAEPSVVLAGELTADPGRLDEARIVVVAGGFSYGDALGAGRVLALDLTAGDGGRLGERLRDFVASGRPVIGICNGFQVLTRAGLLPGALGHNEQGRFDCRWVELAAEPASTCIWTSGLDDPVHCP